MIKLVSTKEMPLDEWRKWRKKGIGGSDAGAICGLNPYRSAIDVFVDKTKEDVDEADNEAMRVGRDLEEYVAQRFCEVTGKKIHRVNAMMQSENYPWMLANVDRKISSENAYLECKTANAYKASEWADGKCPESYEIQCHHYMAVTGADAVYLACLIMGIDFVIVKIERDESIINDLIKIESEFWNEHVLKCVMPPPDGSEAAKEVISEIYSSTCEGDIDMSDDVEKLNRLDELDELIGNLKTEQEQLKQELMVRMGEFETGYINDRKITWKMQNGRTTIDGKRLREECPEIYDEYSKTGTPFRVFKIAKLKKEA